jgi:hypothetical protein
MPRSLLTLLLLLFGACASGPPRETSTAFSTRHSAEYVELTDALEQLGWLIQDEQYGFHHDPRGFVGDRYDLERPDSRGRATLFVFTAESGPGSVLVDVSDEVSDGRRDELFDGLRELFDAAPGWRDPGVVYCLDHDPRHIASFEAEADRERAMDRLRAQSGCKQLSWNEPR